MSDVELVIKIPEETLGILRNKIYCGIYDSNLYKAVANGTPLDEVLDKIRDEIEQIADEEQKHDEKWAIGLRYAVKIIDKYKGKSEDKYCHCDARMSESRYYAELAKSFAQGLRHGFLESEERNADSIGENTHKTEVVMTKEVFQEFYKKLVKSQPKTGHWIKRPNGFKCSKCLIVHKYYSIHCPTCGAKMIEPQESEGV